MKRLVSIIFALLYLSSVTGWALNLHYCGGELNCISLWVKDDCCGCPVDEEPGCCSDEGLFIKATDDSHTGGNTTEFSLDLVAIETPLPFSLPLRSTAQIRTEPNYCAFDLPPPKRIILFRTFLI